MCPCISGIGYSTICMKGTIVRLPFYGALCIICERLMHHLAWKVEEYQWRYMNFFKLYSVLSYYMAVYNIYFPFLFMHTRVLDQRVLEYIPSKTGWWGHISIYTYILMHIYIIHNVCPECWAMEVMVVQKRKQNCFLCIFFQCITTRKIACLTKHGMQ